MPAMSRAPASKAQLEAHDYIRAKILSGGYPGGTWLKPQAIADELKLSRMPVREALRGLEMEGLVTIRPNRGAVVTELTVQEVDDLYDIRGRLEALAARTAATNLTPSSEAKLKKLERILRDAGPNIKAWNEAHNNFHNFISKLSGRKRLIQEIDRVRALMQPYTWLYLDVYGTLELPANGHSVVVKALLSRDADRIDDCLYSHAMFGRNLIHKFLDQHYRHVELAKKFNSRGGRAA
jgi:DNA-binding GntR family transcriptional regulator